MKVLQIIGLLLVLGVPSYAQIKIGVVNGYLFYDEKIGIRKLAKIVKFLDSQHNGCTYRCGSLREKIVRLRDEIGQLKVLGKSADEKTLELSKIEEELKSIKEADNLAYKKSYAMFVEPIEKQVKVKLELFSVKNEYKKIFNVVEYEDSILYVDESIDITKEFIKFCNEEFEKEKTPNK